MDDRFNTPHTDKIELDFLGYRLQLAQDPNSRHLGTTVWDSSMVLVKFLEQNCRKGEFSHSRLAGKRVIEVGAGCGLAGLGMALLGCHVVATDQVEVLPLLMRNLERNMSRAKHSPSESPYIGVLGSTEVAELNWGDTAQIEALNPPFDYIIGADIVYKEQLLEPLLETFLGLAGPKTTILLANEYRSSVVHERMLQLWKENFHMKIIPRSKMDSKYQHEYIQLFCLKLKMKCTGFQEIESNEEDAEITEESTLCGNSVITTFPCSSEDGKESKLSNVQLGEQDVLQELSNGNAIQNNPDPNSLNDSKLSEWETRRLGSMAARMLQNAL